MVKQGLKSVYVVIEWPLSAFTELKYGLNICHVVCILLAMSLLRVQHTVKYSSDQFLKGSKVLIELGGAQV